MHAIRCLLACLRACVLEPTGQGRESDDGLLASLVSFSLRSITTGTAQAKLETFPLHQHVFVLAVTSQQLFSSQPQFLSRTLVFSCVALPEGNTPCPRASGRTLAANSVLTPFQSLACPVATLALAGPPVRPSDKSGTGSPRMCVLPQPTHPHHLSPPLLSSFQVSSLLHQQGHSSLC